MKKHIGMILCATTVLGLFIYIQSQDEGEKTEEKKVIAPVVSSIDLKKLLHDLGRQLLILQKNISEHSERLAGVFARWKKEGKIKQLEQWNPTKNAIMKLLSELKIVTNSPDLLEKLRRNKEIFDILSQLNKDAQPIIARKEKVISQIMQLSSLYGKAIFNDKLLEKLAQLAQVTPSQEPGALPEFEQEYAPPYETTLDTYDDFSLRDQDYTFEDFDWDGFDDDYEFDDFGFNF